MVVPGSVRTYLISNLKPRTLYEFQLVANGPFGKSDTAKLGSEINTGRIIPDLKAFMIVPCSWICQQPLQLHMKENAASLLSKNIWKWILVHHIGSKRKCFNELVQFNRILLSKWLTEWNMTHLLQGQMA